MVITALSSPTEKTENVCKEWGEQKDARNEGALQKLLKRKSVWCDGERNSAEK